MTKKQILLALLLTALVAALLNLSGFGVSRVEGQAEPTNTRRATRDRTTNPKPTRDLTKNPKPTRQDSPTGEPTRRPTRDRTTNPKPTRDLTANPKPTRASDATATPVPAPKNKNAAVKPRRLTSRLLIVNPHRTGNARVKIEVFDSDGNVAHTQNIKIQKNAAKIFTLPESVGNNFLGSARITANRRIQALVLDSDNGGTSSDTYEATGSAPGALTLPLVRHIAPGTQNSIIAIQNTASAPAAGSFTAYDANGAEVLSHPLSIPPNASVYLNTDDLFGSTQFLGSARITADRTLAAAELTLNKHDSASFDALYERDSNNKHVVLGIERKRRKDGKLNGWNELYVRNDEGAPSDITVKYYKKTGKVSGKLTRKNVPPGGLAVFDTREADLNFLGLRFSGWATVTGKNGARVSVHSLASRTRAKQWMGLESIVRSRINGRGVCGDLQANPAGKSILTLVNTHAKQKALVHLRFYKHEKGQALGSHDLELKPNSQISLVPGKGLPTNFRGIVLIDANTGDAGRIVAMVTTQTFKNGVANGTTAYLCS
jgi:hypothetical protein